MRAKENEAETVELMFLTVGHGLFCLIVHQFRSILFVFLILRVWQEKWEPVLWPLQVIFRHDLWHLFLCYNIRFRVPILTVSHKWLVHSGSFCYSFDNIFSALLTLYFNVSLTGWTEVQDILPVDWNWLSCGVCRWCTMFKMHGTLRLWFSFVYLLWPCLSSRWIWSSPWSHAHTLKYQRKRYAAL